MNLTRWRSTLMSPKRMVRGVSVTYGYVGQRLPVQQYPVIGFLTNPYLGWANPIGS